MDQTVLKQRYHFIDALRGFTILVMIGYHFSYDVFILYDVYPKWLSNPFGFAWQQYICITFILLSGLCASFSRSHLKRGLLLNLCGLSVTVVTRVFSPEAVIYFGVLNLLGCSLFLLIPIKRWVNQKHWKTTLSVSFLLFLLTRKMTAGYIGIVSLELIQVPEFLYEVRWLTPFGFPYPGFFSSDYFPILPWFFLFLTGYCLSFGLRNASERVTGFLTREVPFLSWLGRKSLIVYLLHQPVLMLICTLLF